MILMVKTWTIELNCNEIFGQPCSETRRAPVKLRISVIKSQIHHKNKRAICLLLASFFKRVFRHEGTWKLSDES